MADDDMFGSPAPMDAIAIRERKAAKVWRDRYGAHKRPWRARHDGGRSVVLDASGGVVMSRPYLRSAEIVAVANMIEALRALDPDSPELEPGERALNLMIDVGEGGP